MPIYKPNIPAASDKLRVSQSELQANFGVLNSSFEVDHITYDDVTGDTGKHSASTFVNRTDKGLVIPPPTSAEELALFVEDDADGTPQIWYQEPDSAGSGVKQQVSGSVVKGAAGEIPLIGGHSMKWFRIVVNASGIPVSVVFSAQGLTPYTTALRSIHATMIGSENNALILSATTLGFILVGIFNTGPKVIYVTTVGI